MVFAACFKTNMICFHSKIVKYILKKNKTNWSVESVSLQTVRAGPKFQLDWNHEILFMCVKAGEEGAPAWGLMTAQSRSLARRFPFNSRPQNQDGSASLLTFAVSLHTSGWPSAVSQPVFVCQLAWGVISLVLSYLSMQDVASERLEHTGTAHIANAEAGPLKGQNAQPVNGVLSRYSWRWLHATAVCSSLSYMRINWISSCFASCYCHYITFLHLSWLKTNIK